MRARQLTILATITVISLLPAVASAQARPGSEGHNVLRPPTTTTAEIVPPPGVSIAAPRAAAKPHSAASKIAFGSFLAPDNVITDSNRSLLFCLVNRGGSGELVRDGVEDDHLRLSVPLGAEGPDLEADGASFSCAAPMDWDCAVGLGMGSVEVTVGPLGPVVAVAAEETVCFELIGVQVNGVEGMTFSVLDQRIDKRRASAPLTTLLPVFKSLTGTILHADLAEVLDDQHHDKTTSFTELTDTATDAQIPDDITIDYAASAGDLMCVDCVETDELVDGSVTESKLAFDVATQAELDALRTELTTARDQIDRLEDLLQHFSRVGDTVSITGANLHVIGTAGAPLLPSGECAAGNEVLFVNTNVEVRGANLDVRNGSGLTESTNGCGNVIVGYNEERPLPATNDRSGSHMLVVGRMNNFTNYGGVVVGLLNETAGWYSSVTGGLRNSATGHFSSVSGGGQNTASGTSAAVSGGRESTASGLGSAVSGGYNNLASGHRSWVSGGEYNEAIASGSSVLGGARNKAEGSGSASVGGQENTASGSSSTVSGGYRNDASGQYSSVSGGRSNTAGGQYSSVSGGNGNMASVSYSSVSGGAGNTASGEWSSVSGGNGNMASVSYSSVSGGRQNVASGEYSSVSGGNGNTASGEYSSACGGYQNTAGGDWSSVSGGRFNTASGDRSSVDGGENNLTVADQTTVSGGCGHTAVTVCDHLP